MSIPTVGLGRAWRREIGALVVWQILWLIGGLLSGYPLAASLLGLVLYLGVQMAYAYRLHRWLVAGGRDVPEAFGVWQEIYLEFYQLNQRNRNRKKRLKNIVSEFQASTAALPDGAVVLDAHGRIVWFNQAAAALLALRSPHDMGQRIVNLVRHPRFAAYLAAGEHDQPEIEVPSAVREGAVVSLRVIPYGNDQRLLIARDVSAQKQLEATRRDFVANASHELRTPLTVLRGYLEMMAEETDESGSLARWQSPVREMGEQATRMSRIIESLLKLARIEAEGYQQRQEVVNVPELINRVVSDAQRASQREHPVETEIQADLFLYGRPGELESVFSNLIGNALRYTPGDGDIIVYWWHTDEAAYFAVTDGGVGVETRHIERLTERFYRVDDSRESGSGGTGLGLSIVKHCLEHHEAELSIASERNIGSTFTCRFPQQRVQLREAA